MLVKIVKAWREQKGASIMIYDDFPLEAAEGTVLAHALRCGGRLLKKGRVLGRGDLAALAAEGRATVAAVRLEDGDVDEDSAAALVAQLLCGANLRLTAAFTGRCNVVAEVPGLVLVEAAQVDSLNRVDPAVTVATLRSYAPVRAGQIVATVKIIPFAVAGAPLTACCALAREGEKMLRLAPFAARAAGLVLTRIEGGRERLLDKAAAVLKTRLEGLGSTLGEELRCAHEPAAVTEAVTRLLEQGCWPIIVCGATATVDCRDVVPQGIAQAGGRIEHFGMPVDPGNLLLLARHGTTPVIGMPGCARSLKSNGFDWVLERILAGLSVQAEDIMTMGVGGLLEEMPSRYLPREMAVRGESAQMEAEEQRRIGAVVLAAGESRRMGATNKLLAEVNGQPLVRIAAAAALASRADPVIVVTGFDREAVAAALKGLEVTLVHAPDFATGMSATLRRGLAALPGDVAGAVICLADMPGVGAAEIDRLIAAFASEEERAICVSSYHGKRGNPVLWSRRFFDEMAALSGAVGARPLLRRYAELVHEVAMESPAVVVDVDTPEDLAAVLRGESKS
jgi:molybdenum cofactor cytidylyltransferase